MAGTSGESLKAEVSPGQLSSVTVRSPNISKTRGLPRSSSAYTEISPMSPNPSVNLYLPTQRTTPSHSQKPSFQPTFNTEKEASLPNKKGPDDITWTLAANSPHSPMTSIIGRRSFSSSNFQPVTGFAPAEKESPGLTRQDLSPLSEPELISYFPGQGQDHDRSSLPSSGRKIAADEDEAAGNNAGVIVAAARQARLKRPTLVEHQSSNSGVHGAQVAGVKEFIVSRRDTGRKVREKKKETSDILEVPTALNTDIKDFANEDAKAPGSKGVAREEAAVEDGQGEVRDEVGAAKLFNNRKMSLGDALRMNPPTGHSILPRRAATISTPPLLRRSSGTARSFVPKLGLLNTTSELVQVGSSPGKRTSFAPVPFDSSPGRRFQRESIVSTPYPNSSEGEIAGDRSFERRFKFPARVDSRSRKADGQVVRDGAEDKREAETVQERNDALMMLKLRIGAGSQSKEARIVIGGGGDKDAALDDEALMRAVKAEYVRLRGRARAYCSARGVRALRIRRCDGESATAAADGGEDAEKLLRLYREPASGKGNKELVVRLAATPPAGRLLEILLSFSPTRLIFALVLATILSLVTVFVALFVGTSEYDELAIGAYALDGMPLVQAERERFRGVAGRLEGPMALGVLVLLLGWTVVGGWVLASWAR